MPFTLSAAQTIAGIANSYEVTGTGNLDDLVTACSAIGMTRQDKEVVYNPTVANILAISGTLSDTRTGVYTVRIARGHICWAYAAASSITLGAKNAAGAYTSTVNLLYATTALGLGADPYNSQVGRCAIGSGSMTLVSGSILYSQSSRSDLNFYALSSPGAVVLDNVIICQSTGTLAYTTIGSTRLTTTGKTAILTAPRPHHYYSFSTAALTIAPVFTDAGIRMLSQGAAQITRVLQPLNAAVDAYLSNATSRVDVVDPITQYSGPVEGSYQAYPGIKRILRTLNAKFTDNLGAAITNATPKLVTLTSGGTTTVSNFSGATGTSEVLQSTRNSGVTHNDAGLGYTDEGAYSFYAVGFGYASSFASVNVKTANSGNAGVLWNPTATKSTFVNTPYASVVTAPFSFSTTGNGTLTVATSATVAQMAEYLFKLAYDNADAAFWRGLSHTPVTQVGTDVSFGAISITVSSGATVTGANFRSTGTITNNGTIVPTFTDSTGTRVSLTNRNGVVMTSYVLINGTAVGGATVGGSFIPGFVPLVMSRTLTVQPADTIRMVVNA